MFCIVDDDVKKKFLFHLMKW